MTELEWKTRKERIDKKLRAITPGWDIIPYHDGLDVTALDHHAVTEFQTANGPADYALFVKGKLLGIIEAKKLSVGPQNVLEQAKRYSRGAFNGPGNIRPGHKERPFMKQREQARLLLKKASQDEALLNETLSSPSVSDEIFGFHCQQAAEKLLKAALSLHGVEFVRTHNLRFLMDLLGDAGPLAYRVRRSRYPHTVRHAISIRRSPGRNQNRPTSFAATH